jgi:hypothetical protein
LALPVVDASRLVSSRLVLTCVVLIQALSLFPHLIYWLIFLAHASLILPHLVHDKHLELINGGVTDQLRLLGYRAFALLLL